MQSAIVISGVACGMEHGTIAPGTRYVSIIDDYGSRWYSLLYGTSDNIVYLVRVDCRHLRSHPVIRTGNSDF